MPGPLYQQVHPYPQHVHRKGESPARQRRRARHAAAQPGNAEKAKETDDVTEKVAEEVVTAENKGNEGDSVEENLIEEIIGLLKFVQEMSKRQANQEIQCQFV